VIGARQIYPAFARVPVWRYRELYDFITGEPIGYGWRPEKFVNVEVGSALDRAIRPV
jgi:hypothetical protein